ncbi:extracellular solute-binding protein [Lachnotalea sp. AF33-28]|jgi:putative aldouronate transport system substrate-binding protein|uniref:extracellular solute-binding protein n=1 Tax=Lachnotalea sp. AF33-28 TaxID=2292046 RepID=UPI000E4BA92C|nr:extracellular solute-binding protein [Lachnotalea sp. AF33-28]RHP36176.1 extracellular solute-binding protein [Lachnotalea sp. AF33-28]
MKRKMVAFLLTIVLCMSVLFAGCVKDNTRAGIADGTDAMTGNTETVRMQDENSQAGDEEPVKISLCMPQTSWGKSIDSEMMEAFKKVIEEKTNTQIEMISPPSSDYQDRLNVLLTSGEIPDIYVVQSAQDNIPLYGIRGYAAPLNEYLEKDANFDVLKDFDLSAFQVGSELYGVPNDRPMNKIIWVRKDAIDRYGLDIQDEMTTDEFVTEMKKVNQSEMIPFTFPKFLGNFQLFYNFFGAYAGIVQGEDGKYIDGFQTEEMKEAILYIKDLYDQGILDREFITNENSMMREKVFTGKAAAVCDYFYNYLYYLTQSEGVDAYTDFIPIYTLEGPNGHKGNLNESFQNGLCISAKSEHKEKAMEVLSWLFFTDEGVLMTRVGVEGVHYTVENGVITPSAAAADSGYSINVGNLTLAFPVVDQLDFKWGGITDEAYPKQLDIQKISQAPGTIGPKYNITLGVSDLYDKNVATYTSTMNETVVSIVLGNESMEDAYKSYEGFWKSIRGDEMLEELNANQ